MKRFARPQCSRRRLILDKREFHYGIHDCCEFGGFFGTLNSSPLFFFNRRILSVFNIRIVFYIKPILQGLNMMHGEVRLL